MPAINWNRITIAGKAYIIEASAKTEKGAAKKAAKMGCKYTRQGSRYIIIRPTGVMGQPVLPGLSDTTGATQ